MGMKMREDDEEGPRTLLCGIPELERCDNKISTSKYSLISFIPVATIEQFRRVANLYFLIMGVIMAIGWYTEAYESAISPWTTLGPLALVISISLLQEGLADMNRHKSDEITNNAPCVILNRAEQVEDRESTILDGADVTVNLDKLYFLTGATATIPTKGEASASAATAAPHSCKIAFERVRRKHIRQGHLVLIRNRDMVPADLVLLASSSDNGNAYIETSSIDGETNLKLRTSPHLPDEVLKHLRHESGNVAEAADDADDLVFRESLTAATKRITRLSALAFPNGKSALENPANPVQTGDDDEGDLRASVAGLRLKERMGSVAKLVNEGVEEAKRRRSSYFVRGSGHFDEDKYIGALKSEPPNASVNTFSGSLTVPPVEVGGPSIVIPLNAENMLLRGAVLRNTEWAIGLSCFTGTDTKLVRNSFETPSKFSQLDKLMNQTVLFILLIMFICIACLATLATVTNNNEFEQLWYVGMSSDPNKPWPYFPEDSQVQGSPDWETSIDNWVQIFFLYVTLLNNFVPLSLYVTVEIVTAALRIFINLDIEMYHPETDTRTVARSTTVTDLGQVQYVFSDKTGTLTQNVMRFKRCSVDGNVFGAPVAKASPGVQDDDEVENSTSIFHPLKRLLTGRITVDSTQHAGTPGMGLEGLGGTGSADETNNGPLSESENLTFNSEMFLRVMSLCHTVVVEKDLDKKHGIIERSTTRETTSSGGGIGSSVHGAIKSVFRRRKNTAASDYSKGAEGDEETPYNGPSRDRADTAASATGRDRADTAASALSTGKLEKNKDGAPGGYAYQAESPDEGALVQASSLKFGFQVVGRDSSGIRLACSSPTLLSDENVVKGFKNGTISASAVAAETASPTGQMTFGGTSESGVRTETWKILAVNKFDSTRKRMSVLVRSPEELGSIPMLFCKGADTAMLDPSIVDGGDYLVMGGESPAQIARMSADIPPPASVGQRGRQVSIESLLTVDEEEDWERSVLLSIQSHLSDFAREGLRTLVLGVRILSEDECQNWLNEYNEAAAAIKNRDEKLTAAAANIEKKIHIVGATAIEDKLQDGVPASIAKLGEAGIKLWVLTGDKRETAKEIGYATNVLTEKMSPLIEVPAASEEEVRTRMAMEFMKLVKFAKLPDYQRVVVDQSEFGFRARREKFFFLFGKCRRSVKRTIRRFYHKYIKCIFVYCFSEIKSPDPALIEIDEEVANEKDILMVTERKQGVRNRAEKIVRDYVKKYNISTDGSENLSLNSGEQRPDVFSRGQSARLVMQKRRSQGITSATELRSLTLANVTAHDVVAEGEAPLVDEEVLSMRSMMNTEGETDREDYDKAKRNLMERIFAVDRAVRHGRLVKHLKKNKLETIKEGKSLRPLKPEEESVHSSIDGPRALVIEGAALDRLLGDAQLEEILFAVAKSCDSVIACRVSPAQKAQLVQLVRRYVVPEPVTLAIGDGANDVGMIQEAHVGVGISGKEGQQAVNASDFSIAQFRFLEELLLIHGRWNFLRMSTVVFFSFYKNAVMAGCLITYSGRNLYSGTPLFDEWVIAVLNFVAGVPIMVLGFFDRCLDKDYIRAHPEVYGPTRTNEIMTFRILLRWVTLVFIHIFTLYYLTVPVLAAHGGGTTSAFLGLMSNYDPDVPGNGEAGDLKSVGIVTYSCLVLLLAYKVSYEAWSIIRGEFPYFRCKKAADGTTWADRLNYTWIGTAYCSLAFYVMFVYIYNSLGQSGASQFSYFVGTVTHAWNMRSITWMLILCVPIAGIMLDITGKVFANLFFPTQTQIHVEIFSQGEDSKRLPQSPYGEEKHEEPVEKEPTRQRAISEDVSMSC